MTATDTPRVERSSLLHHGRVFDLYQEQIIMPHGGRAQLEIIRHPGAAAIVALNAAREVLMVFQHRHAVGGRIWEIPAGTTTPGEPHLACAQRELIEETGFAAALWDSLGSITPVPGYSTERIELFLARELTPAQQQLDSDELLDVHCVPWQRAMEMVYGGEIQDAKTIVGLCLADRRLANRRA